MRARRLKLSDDVWEKVWESLVYLLRVEKKPEVEKVIFSGLMTDNEKVVMAKRLVAQLLLLSGWKVTMVMKELKLSPASVYKYMEMMKLPGYENELRRLFPEKIEPVKGKLESGLGDAVAKFLDVMWRGYHRRDLLKYPEQ